MMKAFHPQVGILPLGTIYSESIFVDSGAHSIYNIEVLKHGERKGKTGRNLDKPPVRWSQGDFSYYDLKKGSEFRRYCDNYASFMKRMRDLDKGILCANVDAISNPQLTWEIQRYFEEEHGVTPVPIIHYGTEMKWVDRYLGDTGSRYDLLGVGGLGQGVSRHEYFGWADAFFSHICPASNHRLPVIKTHGFAMTSWELVCTYPWWSIDSATWVKLSAYGWLYVPRWSHEREDWRWDVPPMMVNVSFRSPQKMISGKHYDYGKTAPAIRETVDHWLRHLGLEMGSTDAEGKVKIFGVSSHHRARSIANLRYLKHLEESRPPWPYPLDYRIVERGSARYRKGFGL